MAPPNAALQHHTRMLAEKLPSLGKAAEAVSKAMLAGKRPDEVMQAGLATLNKKVRANRKRLMQ